jgi:hypothetical protein
MPYQSTPRRNEPQRRMLLVQRHAHIIVMALIFVMAAVRCSKTYVPETTCHAYQQQQGSASSNYHVSTSAHLVLSPCSLPRASREPLARDMCEELRGQGGLCIPRYCVCCLITRPCPNQYDELHWEEPFKTGNPIPRGYKDLDYGSFQVDRYDGFIIPDSGQQYAMSFEGRGNISVHDTYSSPLRCRLTL